MPPHPTLLHLTRPPAALPTPHPRVHPALTPPSHHHQTKSHISTTATGTNYERLTLLALQPLAFDLRQVGGRADRGIDLIGRWRLPPPFPRKPASFSSSSSLSSSIENGVVARTNGGGAVVVGGGPKGRKLDIPVIAQCKGHKSTPHPAWVRELEGAMTAAPGEWSDGVGVLVSMGKATAGVREAVMEAGRGLVWVQMMEEGEEEEGDGGGGGGGGGGGDMGREVRGRGSIGQLLWNKRVEGLVGEGVGVGFVYRPMGGGKVARELRLMYEGKVWEPEPGA